MKRLLLAITALALPFAAQAQSTKIVNPATGLPVFSTANPAPVTIVSGTLTTGTVTPAGADAAGASPTVNPIVGGCIYNATPLTSVDTKVEPCQLSSRGEVLVKLMSNGSGMSDGSGVFVEPKPQTSGGLSFIRLVAATNGVIKASAGQLYTCYVTNTNAAIRYLQIYNKATAGTLSTDTPVATAALPTNVQVPVSFLDLGGAFATGISWQETTDDVAIPTTAGSTTDIHGFCTFK